MVCKNCGADLKPGIKYCLECGNYIDESEYKDSTAKKVMSGGGAYRLKSARRRKKSGLSLTDILIYTGLAIVIIVSLIIIIYTLTTGNQEEVITEPPVVTGDEVITVDSFELTIPRSLNYDVQGSTLYVSDNKNYTFSYRNTTDSYELYSKDLKTLAEDLKENQYEVISISKKDVFGREFIICEIKVSGRTKYLYLTKLSKYTTMGVIDPYEGGEWEEALVTISDLNSSIQIPNDYVTYYEDGETDTGNSDGNTSSSTETYTETSRTTTSSTTQTG